MYRPRKNAHWSHAGIAAVAAILLAGTSCTWVRVKSDPPDARVLWSRSGHDDDWRPWPPTGAWIGGRDQQAPVSSIGLADTSVFVTAEADGYRRPLPQLVEMYPFSRRSVQIQLEELPELTDRRMRSEGYLRYKGQWVRPEEAGVEEYNGVVMPKEKAFALRQQAAGLVEYNGEWLTPADANARIAQERTAAGFVLHKERWVRPEVAEAETRIDDSVGQLLASTELDLGEVSSPRVIGRIDATDARVQMVNSSAQTVRFLFSGPMSREYTIPPFQSLGVRTDERILLPQGRYSIAILPQGVDAAGRPIRDEESISRRTLVGSWPVPAGSILAFNYTGVEGDLTEKLSQFEEPRVDLDFAVPQIVVPQVQLRSNDRSTTPGMRRRGAFPGGGAPGGGAGPGGGGPGGGRSGGGPR